MDSGTTKQTKYDQRPNTSSVKKIKLKKLLYIKHRHEITNKFQAKKRVKTVDEKNKESNERRERSKGIWRETFNRRKLKEEGDRNQGDKLCK